MLKNFLWQREDQPQNMLSYVFLFMNAVYGTTFAFFSNSDIVQNSAFALASVPPIAWGAACLLLVVLTLFTIATRTRWLGSVIGMLGFTVWCYGFALYMIQGLLFAALVVYVPQMLFWTFWYIGVKRFYRRKDIESYEAARPSL